MARSSSASVVKRPSKAVAGVRKPKASPGAAQVLLASRNAMFDIVTTRNTSTRSHQPLAIYVILDLEFPRRGLIGIDGEDKAFNGPASVLRLSGCKVARQPARGQPIAGGSRQE